jgi:hypothetical protein
MLTVYIKIQCREFARSLLRFDAFVPEDNNVMVPDKGHRAMWYIRINLYEEPLLYSVLIMKIKHLSET